MLQCYLLALPNRTWFGIDDKYNRIIFYLQEHRIFLIDALLSEKLEESGRTFTSLRSYLRLVFDIYRIRINDFHDKAFEDLAKIRLVGRRWTKKSYTTRLLSPDPDLSILRHGKSNKLIEEVYGAYDSRKNEFEKIKHLLPGWPQLIDELQEKHQNR